MSPFIPYDRDRYEYWWGPVLGVWKSKIFPLHLIGSIASFRTLWVIASAFPARVDGGLVVSVMFLLCVSSPCSVRENNQSQAFLILNIQAYLSLTSYCLELLAFSTSKVNLMFFLFLRHQYFKHSYCFFVAALLPLTLIWVRTMYRW